MDRTLDGAGVDKGLERLIAGIGYTVLSGVFLVTPYLVARLLMAMTLGKPLTDVTPVWNDELVYWHGILTFLRAGFDGGYYTFDEYTAPWTLSHFDPHGPAFFVIMGILSLWGKWTASNAVYTNVLAIALGGILYLVYARPTARQLWCAVGVLGTFWYSAIFLPMTMQESLQTGFALAVAGMLAHFYTVQENVRWSGKVVALTLIVIASFTRPMWAFSLIACALLWWRKGDRGAVWLQPVALVCLMVSILYLFPKTSSPYFENSFFRIFFSTLEQNPLSIFGLLLERASTVFRLIGRGLAVEIATRHEVLGLLGVSVLSLIWCVVKRKKESSVMTARVSMVLLASFGSVALMLFTLHDIFDLRDYRTLSPHLLCALMFLVATRHYMLPLAAIAFHLTTLYSATESFAQMHFERYMVDQSRIAQFAAEVGKYVRYDGSARSGWCNTVLTHAYRGYAFPPEIAALPAGVGFSILTQDGALRYPIQSKYLFIDGARAHMLGAKQPLQLLVTLGSFSLYRNNSSGCERGG